MAKITATTGGIDSTYIGHVVFLDQYGQEDGNYFSVAGLTYKQPRSTRDNTNLTGYTCNVDLWVADDSTTGGNPGSFISCTGTIDGNKGATSVTIDDGSAYVAAWTAQDGDARFSGKTLAYGDPFCKSSAFMGVVRTKFVDGSATQSGKVEIRAISVQQELDNAPSTSTFEICALHDPSSPSEYEWTPYDENESCCAYTMQQVIVKNTNRVIAKTSPAYSIPLYDDNVSGL